MNRIAVWTHIAAIALAGCATASGDIAPTPPLQQAAPNASAGQGSTTPAVATPAAIWPEVGPIIRPPIMQ